MAQILLELDNQLKLTDIVVPLTNTSKEEAGDNYFNNKSGKLETAVNGIMVPLIELNNIVIAFEDVLEFELESDSILPTIYLKILDSYDLTKTLDRPKKDNLLRILVLPPFDNAYKKINLTFYITDIDIENSIVSVSGKYKIPELFQSRFESFGEINSYDLYKKIAINTKLGYATNIESNDCDKKYVYCNNSSYLDIMKLEIKTSGSEDMILDCWVDFWNNINLVDIKERYETVDEEKDMLIWITGQYDESNEGIKRKPILTGAILNNNPLSLSSLLYVESYKIENKSNKQITNGTDKLCLIFNMKSNKLDNYIIADGEYKKNIIPKSQYIGEVYGDTNYFKLKKCRDAYLLKITCENIKIKLKTPLLALMRGSKVNFVWYNDNTLKLNKEKVLKLDGFLNENPQSNIPIQEDNSYVDKSAGNFELDKNISGQYLITACDMKYHDSEWEYILTINKPHTDGLDALILPE